MRLRRAELRQRRAELRQSAGDLTLLKGPWARLRFLSYRGLRAAGCGQRPAPRSCSTNEDCTALCCESATLGRRCDARARATRRAQRAEAARKLQAVPAPARSPAGSRQPRNDALGGTSLWRRATRRALPPPATVLSSCWECSAVTSVSGWRGRGPGRWWVEGGGIGRSSGQKQSEAWRMTTDRVRGTAGAKYALWDSRCSGGCLVPAGECARTEHGALSVTSCERRRPIGRAYPHHQAAQGCAARVSRRRQRFVFHPQRRGEVSNADVRRVPIPEMRWRRPGNDMMT